MVDLTKTLPKIKKESLTKDNPCVDSLKIKIALLSPLRDSCWVFPCYSPFFFQTDRKKESVQSKGQRQLRRAFCYLNQQSRCGFYLLFLSAYKIVFRVSELWSPPVHVNSENLSLSSGSHMGNQMLLFSLCCFLPQFEKCAQEPLNSVKLLPWVGREKAVSQRMSPGFPLVFPHLS